MELMTRAPEEKIQAFKAYRKNGWRSLYLKKRELGMCVGTTCLNLPEAGHVRCERCQNNARRKVTVKL